MEVNIHFNTGESGRFATIKVGLISAVICQSPAGVCPNLDGLPVEAFEVTFNRLPERVKKAVDERRFDGYISLAAIVRMAEDEWAVEDDLLQQRKDFSNLVLHGYFAKDVAIQSRYPKLDPRRLP